MTLHLDCLLCDLLGAALTDRATLEFVLAELAAGAR